MKSITSLKPITPERELQVAEDYERGDKTLLEIANELAQEGWGTKNACGISTANISSIAKKYGKVLRAPRLTKAEKRKLKKLNQRPIKNNEAPANNANVDKVTSIFNSDLPDALKVELATELLKKKGA